VFNKCGDERSGANVTPAKFPPKAVLEPFVTWLMMVAGKDDGRTYSLRVGIADIQQLLSNAWNWSATPERARSYIDGLVDAYLAFLDSADDDGIYLDYGYSDLADAIVQAKKKEKLRGDIPESPEEWEALEFASDDDSGSRNSSFNNELVIGETVKAWSRMPDEADVAEVKRRYENLYKLPMAGTREGQQRETEEA
jgi:hypothetical protein